MQAYVPFYAILIVAVKLPSTGEVMNWKFLKRSLLQALRVVLGVAAVMLLLVSFDAEALAKAHWLVPVIAAGLCYFLFLDNRVRGEKTIMVEILGKIRLPLKEALLLKNERAVARKYHTGSDTEGTLGSITETRVLDDINQLSWVLERWQEELGIEEPEKETDSAKLLRENTQESTDKLFR